MAKSLGNGTKTVFGKRKEGKPFKRKSPMDKNVKPTRGQG
jgi:hypothetical protein